MKLIAAITLYNRKQFLEIAANFYMNVQIPI
jgi:hypothetical protein